MLPSIHPQPNDPETREHTQLRLKRWMLLNARMPRAGIIAIMAPSGYDKTRFARMLLNEHWVKNYSTAYVSISALERTPMALIGAIVVALQLPATAQLSILMGRPQGGGGVSSSVIMAAREQFQHGSMSDHLLVLDDLDAMTEEMTVMLSDILLRTMGEVALQIVLCGRSRSLGLRGAGVPVTMITEEDLALSDEELTATGLNNPELRGWPLAVRLALTAMSESDDPDSFLEPLHTLIERLLERVDSRLVQSLEAASIAPDWPLSPRVMRTLRIEPDFITQALSVGLPILTLPNGHYQPHPLLQQVFQQRLEASPKRLMELSEAYASCTDVDTGRQLETLLAVSRPVAEARLAAIVETIQPDDMPSWVAAHTGALWKLYSAKMLTRETTVAVYLARARGESGRMHEAFEALSDPAVRPAGLVMIEEARAHLLSLRGQYVQALAAQKRAVREMERLPVTAESAPVYARTALLEIMMAAGGYAEATVSNADHNAQAALRCAGAEMWLVRTMANSVTARVQALRGHGSSMEGASVAELTTAHLKTPDALGTARLMADGLLEYGDIQGAAVLLLVIQRECGANIAVKHIDLPLLRARHTLLEGRPAMAIHYADAAWSALAEDHRSDLALVLQAGELRILAELLKRHAMDVQQRKAQPLDALMTTVFEPCRLANIREMGARGATLDALRTWMAIQNGEIKGHYGTLERLLPELLEARSVMYVPTLLLLFLRNKMALPVVVRHLQAARNLIGRGPVRAMVSMMAPEIEVPESPRLDVQLYGVPRATLNGQDLQLPTRSMILLAILVTQGSISMAQLAAEYAEDFPSDNVRKKAIIALRDALASGTDGEDMLTQTSGNRSIYSLRLQYPTVF